MTYKMTPERRFFSWLLALCFLAVLPCLAQEESEETETESYDWREAPLYLSAGPIASRFSDSKVDQTKNPFLIRPEFGLFFRYWLSRKYPFYSGIEFQSRGYEINTRKEGKTGDGRTFIQESYGTTRIHYLNVPCWFIYPFDKPEQKVHLLIGPSMSFRVFFRQKFDYSYSIPSDTLVIKGSEDKIRNDAMDYVDFNIDAGLRYRPFPRVEVWAGGTYKMFGLSIAQENFFNTDERNLLFRLKLLFRIGRMHHLGIF